MQRSRLADAQRRQKVLERRLAREKEVEESAGQWEREVLPDWKAAVRDPRLKRLWWDGIPTKLRGRIWYLTLGNALALSKGELFGTSLTVIAFSDASLTM